MVWKRLSNQEDPRGPRRPVDRTTARQIASARVDLPVPGRPVWLRCLADLRAVTDSASTSSLIAVYLGGWSPDGLNGQAGERHDLIDFGTFLGGAITVSQLLLR